MKMNKKIVILVLALGYFVVIQKIISLYIFSYPSIKANLIQLQQQVLPYVIIIEIMLILMVLSMILVYLVLKKALDAEDHPEIKEKINLVMLIFSGIIPIAALLSIYFTGNIFFTSIILIYGLLFTFLIYTMKI
jgi:hypothetical protein